MHDELAKFQGNPFALAELKSLLDPNPSSVTPTIWKGTLRNGGFILMHYPMKPCHAVIEWTGGGGMTVFWRRRGSDVWHRQTISMHYELKTCGIPMGCEWAIGSESNQAVTFNICASEEHMSRAVVLLPIEAQPAVVALAVRRNHHGLSPVGQPEPVEG